MPNGHRFDRFEFRPHEQLLLADGRPVRLGRRASKLLNSLIEHRDRIVPAEELLQLVWAEKQVNEHNLHAQISALRTVLGRDTIATITGRGYRFTRTLEAEAESARILAAILIADVVGYSRLMGEDERSTLEAILATRRAVADHVARHHGRVMDMTGDAFLAAFPSAVESVACALEIQQELAERNAALPEDRRMVLRIGVNLGDVIERGGALYGDGLNVASRLQALGEPGGVSISGAVFDQVEGKLPVEFRFAGEQQVKNIAKPVRIYHVGTATSAPRATSAPARASPAAPTAGKAEGVHRYGPVEVNLRERRLTVAGVPATVGARAFDLLVALSERHDRVVSKGELLDLVWPGVFVEEHNLATQVSSLRRLLGMQAIATIPGLGYRLALVRDGAAPARKSRRAEGALPSGLPYAPETLVGREDDFAHLQASLAQSRLVTLLGAGGVGKSTLALSAAHALAPAYAQGAWWVDLSPVTSPAAVASAVAETLQMSVTASEIAPESLVQALKDHVILLVLDNAEHVAQAVGALTHALLEGTRGVRLLVTSQAPLAIRWELPMRLGGLAIPSDAASPAAALQYGAIAFFVEQATKASRAFELNDENVVRVIELCRSLDGLPLLIKLAAARLYLLGLDELTARLSERFRLLDGGPLDAPRRQRTLLAAMEWSYELLSEDERRVFVRLGVFVRGFSLQLAAAACCNAAHDEWAVIDMLGSLVDKSFVAVEGGTGPRYRLLESARAYSMRRLDERAERLDAERRHAIAVTELFESGYQRYWTGTHTWRGPYALELDNLRAALDWATLHDPQMAMKLLGASSDLFYVLSLRQEARRRFLVLDDAAVSAPPSPVVARYWLQRSMLILDHENASAYAFADRAAALYRKACDAKGLYTALCYQALSSSTAQATFASELLAEIRILQDSNWSPRLRNLWPMAEVTLLSLQGHHADACRVIDDALADAQAAGLAGWAAILQALRADAALTLGEVRAAIDLAVAALPGDRARAGVNYLHTLATLVGARTLNGEIDLARPLAQEFISASRSREWDVFPQFADAGALFAYGEHRAQDAARVLGYADRANARVGDRRPVQQRVRTKILSGIRAGVSGTDLTRLMAQGAELGEEAVSRLILGANALE